MSTVLSSDLQVSSSRRPPLVDIVRAATLAPSADNNQPWRFVAHGDTLVVEHDPSRALPSDVDRMFDLIALGAAIENACVAARHYGWEPSITYLAADDATSIADNQVAEIDFYPGREPDPLFARLADRCTNRRPYSRQPVEASVLSRLAAAAGEWAPDVRLHWAANRPQIRRLAFVVAASDRIRLEHEPFHAELYRQLRFSEAEARQSCDGLDVRTLELPPGGTALLQLLRSWRRTRVLNRCGLSRLLALTSAVTVWRSGALGAISVPRPKSTAFLTAGRAFQRLWLTSAAEGLSLQPLGSLPIFLRHLDSALSAPPAFASHCLGDGHRRDMARLAEGLAAALPETQNRTPVMLFRMGWAPRPANRSLRRYAEPLLQVL